MDDEPKLDVVQWKRMIVTMLVNGSGPPWDMADRFNQWVAECALRAFENGDIDDDVAQFLIRLEQREWDRLLAAAQPPKGEA